LIEALGGIGSFPCWISEAFCATAAGSAGPAPPGATPPCPGAALVPSAPAGTPPAPGDPGATSAGGRLMTVLMMVVLWILAKMMLFGGAAT
jgi:hypothetical protein